ncbi:MAG TPA: hypothetical protein VKV17_07790 [Bryobacteraceae bacterium]|nr:hypothetical protein [Bryobacteraceae bacterium]
MRHQAGRYFLWAPLVLVGVAVSWGASVELRAFQDLKAGPRPATYTANGVATVTCIRAVQSAPVKPGEMPPACYVTGPGLAKRVAINSSVQTNGPGTVTLTCTGNGQLGCSARISY